MASAIRKLYNDVTSLHKHGATHDTLLSGGTGLAIGLASRTMAQAPTVGAAVGAAVLYAGVLVPPSGVKDILQAEFTSEVSKAALAVGMSHVGAGIGGGKGGKGGRHHGELDMGSAHSDLIAAAREL